MVGVVRQGHVGCHRNTLGPSQGVFHIALLRALAPSTHADRDALLDAIESDAREAGIPLPPAVHLYMLRAVAAAPPSPPEAANTRLAALWSRYLVGLADRPPPLSEMEQLAEALARDSAADAFSAEQPPFDIHVVLDRVAASLPPGDSRAQQAILTGTAS